AGQFHSDAAVFGGENGELLEAENGAEIAAHLGFVFDDQDFHGQRGRWTVMVVPLFNLLSTSIFPPCSSMQRLTITRPRPVPGRSPTLRARWKALKSHWRSSSGMPMPRSSTRRTTCFAFCVTARRTAQPAGEYLTAFEIRFVRIWRRRRSSSFASFKL